MPLTGVPGWPFNSRDGDLVIVTTYDEPNDRGYVELLDSGDLTSRRVIDLPAEPFHALPMHDGEHALVALANGDIARISLQKAALVHGTGAARPASGWKPFPVSARWSPRRLLPAFLIQPSSVQAVT